MRAIPAYFEGLRRVLRAPGLVGFLWLVNVLVALPAAIVVEEAIHASVARSHAHQDLLDGFDTGWFTEFSSSASGFAKSLAPSQHGFGAWLDNLDSWWDGDIFRGSPELLAVSGVFALIWIFLLGGVLESMREGAPRPRISTVVADGTIWFPRLLRLALMTGVLYYLVFRLAGWLFPYIQKTTIDLTVEKQVLRYNLLGAALIVGVVLVIRLVSDYAKIALVVDRRKSVALAVARGIAMLLRHPVRLVGLGACSLLSGLVLLGLYTVFGPGSADATPVAIVGTMVLSQAFLAAKFALRVALHASEMALYERLG